MVVRLEVARKFVEQHRLNETISERVHVVVKKMYLIKSNIDQSVDHLRTDV